MKRIPARDTVAGVAVFKWLISNTNLIRGVKAIRSLLARVNTWKEQTHHDNVNNISVLQKSISNKIVLNRWTIHCRNALPCYHPWPCWGFQSTSDQCHHPTRSISDRPRWRWPGHAWSQRINLHGKHKETNSKNKKWLKIDTIFQKNKLKNLLTFENSNFKLLFVFRIFRKINFYNLAGSNSYIRIRIVRRLKPKKHFKNLEDFSTRSTFFPLVQF